jgi:hypothetical protein
MPSATPPPNMKRVTLGIAGLAQQEFNALVAWHKQVSLADPLLVVLFFHGQEPDPQNFAWTDHHLPDQIADCRKNAVLIAPTMQLVQGNVVVDYVATRDRIATLVRAGLVAVRQALGQPADAAWVDQAFNKAGLHPVGYSNGYRGWSAVVNALRSPTSTIDGPPPVIGHSLFDCLYWSTPLMDGVDHDASPDNARFSARGRAILQSAFVTTHFTSANETLLLQAKFLRAMVGRDPSLTLHNQIPGSLGPNEIVMTVLPTPDHDQAKSSGSGLSHVVAAAAGFHLPASPSV